MVSGAGKVSLINRTARTLDIKKFYFHCRVLRGDLGSITTKRRLVLKHLAVCFGKDSLRCANLVDERPSACATDTRR